jgi:hypothetical protein
MKGLVSTEFIERVERQFSAAMVDEVISASAASSTGANSKLWLVQSESASLIGRIRASYG